MIKRAEVPVHEHSEESFRAWQDFANPPKTTENNRTEGGAVDVEQQEADRNRPIEVGDPLIVKVNGHEDEDIWNATSGVTPGPTRKMYVSAEKPGARELLFFADDVRRAREDEIEDESEPGPELEQELETEQDSATGSRFKERINKIKNRIGGLAVASQVHVQQGFNRVLDRWRGPESDEEKRSRTRAVGLFVVGVAAGGVLAYLATRHGHDYSQQLSDLKDQNQHIQGVAEHNKGAVDSLTRQFDQLKDQVDNLSNSSGAGTGGASTGAVPGHEFSGGTHSEALRHSGDTIWNHAANLIERRTGRRPNNETIQKVTNKILHMNGFRWHGGGPNVDSHKLAIGLHFKVPNKIAFK